MYTLIDGVQFYDKDEVDDLFAQNGSTSLSGRLDQEVIDRTAADDALGARIDQEAQELSDKLTQESQELSDKLTQESNVRLLGDQTLANQLTAIEQLWSTLVSANFIDTDSSAIVVDDSGKSVRQIAHDEFYRQLVTDADNVKQQLDTLKELADYLQNNPTILTDIYTKLGITWSLDTPTDFGAFDFSSVLTAMDIDSAIVELYNTLVNKTGDLTQLATAFKGNIVGAVNELDADVGDLSTLTTTNKVSVVAAINEVKTLAVTSGGGGGGGTGIDTTQLETKIGDLSTLTTTNKVSVVAAINEVNGKVVAGGGSGGSTATNYTPFTFVIDSNEALSEWANNDKSKGQDYTSILIRKGEWRCTIPDKGLIQMGRENVYMAYINLGDIGTKYIYGEPGNKLILVSPYSDTGAASAEQIQAKMVYGIRGQDVSIQGPGAEIAHISRDFIMRDVNIEAIGESHYFFALSLLVNIYNCNVIVRAGGGYPIASACYSDCRNVNNCSGSVHVNATGTPDSPVISAGGGGVFTNCFAVSKCYASARCTVATEGIEEENDNKITIFGSSYASWSRNSDYICADTANGGFNDTTNPSR